MTDFITIDIGTLVFMLINTAALIAIIILLVKIYKKLSK